MAGESPKEERAGQPDEFLSKSKWQRFQVLIMGPGMNLILAVVLLAIVLYQGAQVPAFEDQPPVVGAVTAGSPASKADIRPGDLILAVADRNVKTWEEFFLGVGTKPNREINLTLNRSGSEKTVKVTPLPSGESRYEIGDIGVLPDVHPSIRAVNRDEPADRAGLRPDDVVLAVNGETISFSSQLKSAIEKHADQPITLSISRNGVRQNITATPALRGNIGLLGIQIADATKSIKPGALQAIGMSFEQNAKMAGL